MRRNKRLSKKFFVILSLLIAVSFFAWLSFLKSNDSQAASLSNFRPGYIISDYTMSNADSMSLQDIQNFLSSHGNCNDTRTYIASRYPGVHYHIENGHFVCLSQERFGNGYAYGDLLSSSEPSYSAAEIIYEVSHKWNINPQVLIVLLEKEQGLITDSYPHSIQYRSATGFGCPDTVACDTQYYGLKNQLNFAAKLFREVLDGGWTNYPVGYNYVAYNPTASCRGSVINIENRATSAMYRYTPYQPNQGALSAGYGTSYCGSYGNRNFYLYFSDWFGDPTSSIQIKEGWYEMSNPRKMEIKVGAKVINPLTKEVLEHTTNDSVKYFDQKYVYLEYGSIKTCLGYSDDPDDNKSCYDLGDLTEYDYMRDIEITEIGPISMRLKNDCFKISAINNEKVQSLRAKDYGLISFSGKATIDNTEYFITSFDKNNSNPFFIEASNLSPVEFSSFVQPREMNVLSGVDILNVFSGDSCGVVERGGSYYFDKKVAMGGTVYYALDGYASGCAVKESDVFEIADSKPVFVNFVLPRNIEVAAGSKFINLDDLSLCRVEESNRVLYFTHKTLYGNEVFYKASVDSETNCAISSKYIIE